MNPKDKHADWLLKPTANELADIQAFKTEELTIWERNTTATMLRQQQERLTKYELRHAEQRKRIDELEHQQQAEIEALKQIIDANNLNQTIGQFVKPTNKPVAWMDYLEHSDVYDLNVSGRGIPLYTHPVKELTDEEIIEIGLLTTDPRFSHIESPLLLEFARAILRKAQEK